MEGGKGGGRKLAEKHHYMLSLVGLKLVHLKFMASILVINIWRDFLAYLHIYSIRNLPHSTASLVILNQFRFKELLLPSCIFIILCNPPFCIPLLLPSLFPHFLLYSCFCQISISLISVKCQLAKCDSHFAINFFLPFMVRNYHINALAYLRVEFFICQNKMMWFLKCLSLYLNVAKLQLLWKITLQKRFWVYFDTEKP